MADNDDTIIDGADDDFTFDLPPVTESSTGFIGDEINLEEDKSEFTGEINHPENENKKDDIQRSNLSEAEQYRGVKSSKGDEYDPAIHRFPPKETKTGIWFKKTKKQKAQENGGENKAQVTNALFDKAGQSHARMYAELHKVPYGDGAKVIEDETLPLGKALSRYYQSTGLKEFSPKGEVIFQALNYSFIVGTRETNIERSKFFIAKTIGFFQGLYIKLFKRKKSAQIFPFKKPEQKPEKEKAPESTEETGGGDGMEAFYENGDNKTEH